MFKIKISNYAEGIYDLHFSEPAGSIGLPDSFVGNLDVDLRMDRSPFQIVLQADISGRVTLECDRCLGDYQESIETSCELIYMFGSEKEGDADNLYYVDRDQDWIDFSADMKDYSILALPLKRLCSEDCKGLCPGCGANLNEESCSCQIEKGGSDVWEKLR